MKTKLKPGHKSAFERFAYWVTKAAGSSYAFITAFGIIIIWLLSGPIFGFSDTWQLIINTGTTIITFLMVFLIQKSQNRDSRIFQLKLNELISSHEGASNRLLQIDDLSEEELETLVKFYVILAKRAKQDASLTQSHSIEEAEQLHHEKLDALKRMKKENVAAK